MADFTIIGGDRRSILCRDFQPVFETLATLQERFAKDFEFSPYDFTEQTAVSTFVWAAGRQGNLALAEYQVKKSRKPGLKFKRNGRADLWIDFPKRSYSLELKVASYQATQLKLKKKFEAACSDAGCIDTEEHDHAYGVLVAYVADDARLGIYEEFAEANEVRLAVRIGVARKRSCYIYFGEALT